MKTTSSLITLFLLSLLYCYPACAQPAPTKTTIAQQLGFVPSQRPGNYCGGFYQEEAFAPLPAGEEVALTQGPVEIEANHTIFAPIGLSTLKGQVSLRQPDRLLEANEAYLTRDKDGRVIHTDLHGQVYLREPGRLISGEMAHIKLKDWSGLLKQAVYRIRLDRAAGLLPQSLAQDSSAMTPYAWGIAKEVEVVDRNNLHLQQASYTTCAPIDPVWQMTGKKIALDRSQGRGTAQNVVLYFKSVPIFYAPYFNFPLNKQRKTGFLFPTLGSSTNNGFSLSAPYYFNLAPNYDFLLTPTVFSKRGFKLNGGYRYLTQRNAGDVEFAILPYDAEFKKFQQSAAVTYPAGKNLTDLLAAPTTRSYWMWRNTTLFNSHWSSHIDYNYVSDDYYFQDFGNTPAVVSTNQLLRQANLVYAGEVWQAQGLVQSYQTLHPVNQAPIVNQYSSLPKLALSGNDEFGLGWHYSLQSEYVHFTRALGPTDSITPPQADRLHIQPGLSLPIERLYGYITPTLQLATTYYQIYNQQPGLATGITRVLPIFNIDSQLFLQRPLNFHGSAYQQTLEPRFFYLFVPYKNQNDIPVFDSLLPPFDEEQLFRINRFTGLDRIGDANQLAAALTTRFLEKETGKEKMRASLGQIYYFRHRKVTLCSTPNCQDSINVPGATSTTETLSPLVGQLSYQLNKDWRVLSNLSWDIPSRQTINAHLDFQYSPLVNHILRINYDFIRFGDTFLGSPELPPTSHKNNFNQTGISFAWPIKENWHTVGSYNYNISHEHPQTYFYGIEYNSCCWAMRVMAGRTFNAMNQQNEPVFNNMVYLQWQFKGLGTVGTNDPASLLTGTIPGYVNTF